MQPGSTLTTLALTLAALAPAACFTDAGPADVTSDASASSTSASASAPGTMSTGAATVEPATTTVDETTSAAATSTSTSALTGAVTSDASDSDVSAVTTDAATTGDPTTGECSAEICDGLDNDCDALVDELSDDNPGPCDNCLLHETADRLYWICQDFRTWTEARARCQDRGAALVTLETAAERDLLIGLAPAPPNDEMWLGLTDSAREGVFRWPTGATAEDYGYKDWDLDQPVGSPDLNCVYVVNTDSGRWRVAPCDNPKYGYFCEATP